MTQNEDASGRKVEERIPKEHLLFTGKIGNADNDWDWDREFRDREENQRTKELQKGKDKQEY